MNREEYLNSLRRDYANRRSNVEEAVSSVIAEEEEFSRKLLELRKELEELRRELRKEA